ncbi:MAG: twitching motility protein PilT [Chloroflexota bacterium]|nr:MAG: twitching motility protein PilT [Chloroflexota bacterium]
MAYVIDAHALIWYFTNDAKLGVNAHSILKEIDAGNEQGLVPTIVLAEILYASERGRIALSLGDIITELKKRKHYRTVPFTQKILLRVEKIKRVPELHDRLIVATALENKASVVTRDRDIVDSGEVETIW